MFIEIFKKHNNKGFTLIELLVVLGIFAFVFAISLAIFSNLKNTESIDKSTSLVVEILRQAKYSTINSKNASQYGVHFGTNSVVLFTGSTYSAVDPNNKTYDLGSGVSVYSISLNGGGSDVVFNKVTGNTTNDGTITLRSDISSTTKQIIIHKTGLIE